MSGCWFIRKSYVYLCKKWSNGLPRCSVVKKPPGNTGSLIWEDPTCHCAPKPVCHNHCVCAPEPRNCNHWAHIPQVLKPVQPWAPQQEKPPATRSLHTTLWSSPSSPQLDKSLCSNEDPAQPKVNTSTFKKESRQIERVKLSFKVAVPFFLISNEESSYYMHASNL